MKIKADGKGGWTLIRAPKGTNLRRVTISFPSKTSQVDGKNSITGLAKVNIRVEHANGSSEVLSNVGIEW